jgi:hypothetical protein
MERLGSSLKPGNVMRVDLKAGIEEMSEKMKEGFERIGAKLEEKEGVTRTFSDITDDMVKRLDEIEKLRQQAQVDRNRIQEMEKLRVSRIDEEIEIAQGPSEPNQ